MKWLISVLVSLLAFTGCKKKNDTSAPPVSKGKSGQIYFTDTENVIAKSPDGSIALGEGTTDATWLEDDLAWVVLDASKYPKLAELSGSTSEITLAVKSSAITLKPNKSLSLTTSGRSTPKKINDNPEFKKNRDMLSKLFQPRTQAPIRTQNESNQNINQPLSDRSNILKPTESITQNTNSVNSSEQTPGVVERQTMASVLQQISTQKAGIAGDNDVTTATTAKNAEILLADQNIPNPNTPNANVTFQTPTNTNISYNNTGNNVFVRADNQPINPAVRSYNMAGATPMIFGRLSSDAQATRQRNHEVADRSLKNFFTVHLKSLKASENKRKATKALLAVAGVAGLAGLGYGLYYAFFTGEKDEIIPPGTTPVADVTEPEDNTEPEDSYDPLKNSGPRKNGTATPVGDPTGGTSTVDNTGTPATTDNTSTTTTDNTSTTTTDNTSTTTTDNTSTTTIDNTSTTTTGSTSTVDTTGDTISTISLPDETKAIEPPEVPEPDSVIIDFSIGVKVYIANRLSHSDAGVIDLSQSIEIKGEVEVLDTGLQLDCKDVCVYTK